MQTCKFTLTLHPFHSVPMRGVTPAELVILRELHFKESNGSPIGDDLQLEAGEAQTVEVEEQASQAEYFHQGSGKTVPAKIAVPAQTHKRTDREEIDRLKRKYIAPIPHIKGSKPAFFQIFGESPMVRLPETIEEVLQQIGIAGILPPDAVIEDNPEAEELADLSRAELVTKAVKLGLTVKANDGKEAIISKIIDAQAKVEQPA